MDDGERVGGGGAVEYRKRGVAGMRKGGFERGMSGGGESDGWR